MDDSTFAFLVLALGMCVGVLVLCAADAWATRQLSSWPDEAEEEIGCPACHGCGVRDEVDDWGRTLVADVDCARCDGTGVLEEAW